MSTITSPSDPAFVLIGLVEPTTSTVFNVECYICNDPEFSLMGLPLCYPCRICGAHVPADDTICDNGHEQEPPTDEPPEWGDDLAKWVSENEERLIAEYEEYAVNY
jgi:hypothetical protein